MGNPAFIVAHYTLKASYKVFKLTYLLYFSRKAFACRKLSTPEANRNRSVGSLAVATNWILDL